MNAYELKQEARRERLQSAATSASAAANSAFARARAIVDRIPFGQPILVGHHSEGRHRSDLRRSDAAMSRAVAEHGRATELARRAERVGSAGISQDDPDAIAKLEAELSVCRKFSADAKAINAAIRKHAKRGLDAQIAALIALGHSEALARKLMVPDFAGRVGISPYTITNRAANARRIEKRIAELRAKAAAPVREPVIGNGWRIEECREDNRVRITFDARQPDAVIDVLKARGFRWSPTVGSWQRHASNGAWHAAEDVVRVADRCLAATIA